MLLIPVEAMTLKKNFLPSHDLEYVPVDQVQGGHHQISQFDFGTDATKFVQYYVIEQSVAVKLLAIIAALRFC